MAADKTPLRVNFDNAPASVLKVLFGDAKDKQAIFRAVAEIGDAPIDKKGTKNPAVHIKEIFHYVNTDAKGEWTLNESGEPAIGMQSLQRQITALVNTGELAKAGERTGRYTLTELAEIEEDDAE